MTDETKRVVGIAAAEEGPIAAGCTCRDSAAEGDPIATAGCTFEDSAAEAINAAASCNVENAATETIGGTAHLTCIRCPLGCALSVEVSAAGEVMGVTGNQCARGARYGADEATNPMRTVTACICVPGVLEPLSAKTLGSVPRDSVREVAKAIAALRPQPPIRCGDTLCENIANTGVTVVATKDLG